MEPTQGQVKGFADGFDVVIKTLRLCIAKETHANPNIRRMLNEAFGIAIQALITNRTAFIEEYSNALTSPPPEQ